MFWLAEIKNTVRIPPWKFDINTIDAITEELNKNLANKVIHETGLCIALFDITKIEESYIIPGDGASHTKVYFRYVVFRPFMDEILVGKIKSCSREGVHVSLGLFDDILITADSLQHPSRFDETEQLWIWQYENDDESHDLFMDIGEEIRFRIVSGIFVDTSPTGPKMSGQESGEVREAEKKIPYTLIGSIGEPGLGLLSWWAS